MGKPDPYRSVADRSIRAGRFSTSTGMVFERRGSGRPVVLLHGWCLNRRLWTYLEEDLLHEWDVITPDLPGFGRSDMVSSPLTRELYRQEINVLLNELDLKETILIGFAFGAIMAIELASFDATRVGGVISIGIPSAGYAPYDRMPKSMRRDWPDFARRSAEAMFHTQASPGTLAWVAAMFGATALPVAIEALGIMVDYDPIPVVSKVPVPQLFVHGAKDSVSPVALGQACAKAAPNAKLEIIEECGHLIVIDGKDAFHSIVKTYLREW